MKLVQMALLLFVAAVLLGGSPALADQPITTTLTGAADETDPDFGASGAAKLSNIKVHDYWDGSFWYWSDWSETSADLAVNCEGLTPGATYWIFGGNAFTAGPLIASKSGTGGVRQRVAWGGWDWFPVHVVVVYREDTVDGTVQLVPVLEGTFSQ